MTGHTLELGDGCARFTGADGTVLRLSSTMPLRDRERAMPSATSSCGAGETATFILEQVSERVGLSHRPRRLCDRIVQGDDELLARVGRPLHLRGRWRDEVHRSALALKLLYARWSGCDRRGRHLRASRGDRRRAQLGLPVLLDPGRVLHAVRADPTGHDRRSPARSSTGWSSASSPAGRRISGRYTPSPVDRT